jgi:hypothetical protein
LDPQATVLFGFVPPSCGAIVLRQNGSHGSIEAQLTAQPPGLIGMEAR